MKLKEVDIRRFREIEGVYAVSIEELREHLANHGAEAGVEIPEILKPGAAVPEYLAREGRRRVAEWREEQQRSLATAP